MTASSTQVGSELVFFGDSLTDDGNLYAETDGVLPNSLRNELAGPTGAASDGPTYAVYAAQDLGVTTYLNYAVAGAEAIGTQSLGDFITASGYASDLLVPPDDPSLQWDMNLGAQIDRFEADTSGQDLSDATSVILIGLNDYANIDLSNPLGAILQAAQVLAQSVSATMDAAASLVADGMGAVVISSLPDAAFLPTIAFSGSVELALAETLFTAQDASLAAGASDLASQGAPVRYLDITSITAAIAEDPHGFGFIAPYDLTLTSGDPALANYDSDQVAFWDSEHPSTATQAMLGAFQAYALENPVTALSEGSDNSVLASGSDMCFALEGDDTVVANLGNNSIFGGSGSDLLNGRRGSDLLSGGTGNDELHGGRGNDLVAGSEGNDLLWSGLGNDVLIGGLGSDTLNGCQGNDTFIFTQAELIGGATGTDSEVIHGGKGQDILYVVLDQAHYDALAADLQGASPDAALASLGLHVAGVESIVAIDGRGGEAAVLGATDWYHTADTWGLL